MREARGDLIGRRLRVRALQQLRDLRLVDLQGSLPSPKKHIPFVIEVVRKREKVGKARVNSIVDNAPS
jgi:hypothetical protein